MSIILWIVLAIIEISFAQNVTQNGGKSYFFKMGKNSNEFRVNNRIMYLNHNITGVEYPILERKSVYQAVEKIPKFDSSLYLDEEWNYDHDKNYNKNHLPMFVKKFYEETASAPESTPTTRVLFNTNRNKSTSIFKFNLDNLNPQNTIVDADLYFYWPLKNNSKIFKESVVLRLYQIEKHINDELKETELIQKPDIHKLFNVIYISKAQKGWQMFKMKKPIDNWLSGEENLGLILTISRYDTNDLLEVFNDTNGGNFSTFVVVKLQNNDSMWENNKMISEDDDIFSNCKLQSWNVNFDKINWNKFIILPEEFTAYDCVGKCSKPLEKDANHIKFLHIFQKRSACCVPTTYSPLTVMFFDKFGDIAIKNYRNMVIRSCGCR